MSMYIHVHYRVSTLASYLASLSFFFFFFFVSFYSPVFLCFLFSLFYRVFISFLVGRGEGGKVSEANSAAVLNAERGWEGKIRSFGRFFFGLGEVQVDG